MQQNRGRLKEYLETPVSDHAVLRARQERVILLNRLSIDERKQLVNMLTIVNPLSNHLDTLLKGASNCNDGWNKLCKMIESLGQVLDMID